MALSAYAKLDGQNRMRLDPNEVVPGLVVHLDTTELRRLGGCQCNAERTATNDRAVVGPHYFLVVRVDSQSHVATAVPLFSKRAPGSDELIERHKTGLADKWLGVPSYVSRWQHWRIPSAAMVAASNTDEATQGTRRGYAIACPEALEQIANWETKNRAAYRAV